MLQGMTLTETLARTQMKIRKVLLLAILLLPLAAQGSDTDTTGINATALILQHQLHITLKPDNNEIIVKDIITLPDNGQSAFTLKLNSLFHLRYQKRPLHPVRTTNGVSSYHLAVDHSRQLTLRYKGKLQSTTQCSWLRQACTLLNPSGTFLARGSHWYPDIAGAMHRFTLAITLPKNWVSLSQGEQTATGWREDKPQREIYLLAGPFRVYESQPDPAKPKALVYLQQDDPRLAQRYLTATHQYIEQYSRMLGAYPYSKFATVESFWETGWGMPSFTLLGSKVMRLPFILHSSFPHEILHNWWGNGVYVDYRDGNWSEGLTAYLADHYNKSSKKERVMYRREALQSYQAFTAADDGGDSSSGNDFPLRNFRNRHDRTTQAVGYNKALMLFHMLRKQLGEQAFFASLKTFYHDYRFRFAGFRELQQAFATNSPQNLDHFFRQWRDQTGAPQLNVVSHELTQLSATSGAGNTEQPLKLALTLQQTQPGQPFTLAIPVKVEDKHGKYNHQTLHMSQSEQAFILKLSPSARRLLIDPDFDVLRLPDKREVPAALNTLLSRQAKTFLLPRKTPAEMQTAWQEFAHLLSYGSKNMPLQYDDAAINTGDNGVIVFLGADNKPLANILAQSTVPLTLTATAYIINSTHYSRQQHALALSLRHGEQQMILLDTDSPAGLTTLTRKLPHYGKYSYTLFHNTTTALVAKGQWEITDSPMNLQLTNH